MLSQKDQTVPLQAKTKQEGDDDVKHQRGLKNYRPLKVAPHNCGSNLGFTNVLADVLNMSKGLLETKYPLRVDRSSHELNRVSKKYN